MRPLWLQQITLQLFIWLHIVHNNGNDMRPHLTCTTCTFVYFFYNHILYTLLPQNKTRSLEHPSITARCYNRSADKRVTGIYRTGKWRRTSQGGHCRTGIWRTVKWKSKVFAVVNRSSTPCGFHSRPGSCQNCAKDRPEGRQHQRWSSAQHCALSCYIATTTPWYRMQSWRFRTKWTLTLPTSLTTQTYSLHTASVGDQT